jgi:hypothetical protein
LNFAGLADVYSPLPIGDFLPFGDGLGYTSLELLLMRLAYFYGPAIALLLWKQVNQ